MNSSPFMVFPAARSVRFNSALGVDYPGTIINIYKLFHGIDVVFMSFSLVLPTSLYYIYI